MFVTYAWVVVKYFNFVKIWHMFIWFPLFCAIWFYFCMIIHRYVVVFHIKSSVCVHICTFGWKNASSCTLLWATVCIYLSPICSFQWDECVYVCYKQSHGVIWENSVLLYSQTTVKAYFFSNITQIRGFYK